MVEVSGTWAQEEEVEVEKVEGAEDAEVEK